MAEHQCTLTLFPEGEAVCLDCGAFYIFHSMMIEPLLEGYRENNPDICECGCSIQREHDQFGCTLLSHKDTCERKGAWVIPAGVDPWYSCGAAYCDDPACVTHNREHPNHED